MSNMGGENMCLIHEDNSRNFNDYYKENYKLESKKSDYITDNWINKDDEANKHPITTKRKEELK